MEGNPGVGDRLKTMEANLTRTVSDRSDPSHVLTVAVRSAAKRLGVSQKELAAILGISAASLSRLTRGGRVIDPGSKEGELALLFIRLFRSLDALVGGNEASAKRWLRAGNHHLSGVPLDLIQKVQGLVRVVEYLDAMRGTL